MAAESLEMSHFRHGWGQKMCDLMLSWFGSELMRYPLSRGHLEDSGSFILRRKLRSGLEAIPSAGSWAGARPGPGSCIPFFLALVKLAGVPLASEAALCSSVVAGDPW